MAAVAHKCSIERFALVNDFRARFLFRRLRHRRNHNLRIRKRPGGTQLECIESRWPTFRFGGGHGTGGSEQARARAPSDRRSEEHTSELQSRGHLVCRLLLEKKKT